MKIDELAAFTRLVEESKPRLLAMIARRTSAAVRARRDPEDVYQKACEKAASRWSTFDDSKIGQFAWLYGFVLDCLADDRDYQFAHMRSPRVECDCLDNSTFAIVKQLVSDSPGPKTEAERREELAILSRRVAEVMVSLTKSEREVLCMKFYDDLSHREIGLVLKITEVAARKRYCRALIQFQGRWNDLFENPGASA